VAVEGTGGDALTGKEEASRWSGFEEMGVASWHIRTLPH